MTGQQIIVFNTDKSYAIYIQTKHRCNFFLGDSQLKIGYNTKIFSTFNENRMLIPLYDHTQWHSYKIRSVLVWISNRVVIVKRQKKKSKNDQLCGTNSKGGITNPHIHNWVFMCLSVCRKESVKVFKVIFTTEKQTEKHQLSLSVPKIKKRVMENEDQKQKHRNWGIFLLFVQLEIQKWECTFRVIIHHNNF